MPPPGRPGKLVFATSADYARYTGGYVYNERLVAELSALGWEIERLVLPAGFPDPTPQALASTARALDSLAEGCLVLIDQLCISPAPELARAQGARLRLIVIVHHPLALEGPGRRPDAERAALAHATRLIVTSPRTRQAMIEDYGVDAGRIVLACPGVDRLRRACGSAGGALALTSVGAVVPRKAHGVLLEALAGLTDRPWRLTIVGDLERAPEHVAAIRARVSSAGLLDRVKLTGSLDAEAMEQVWQGTDLFVAASQHEGFGMAIAEAIERGLPVVTTAAGAVGDWLDRGAAIVVPTGDPVALRSALGRVLNDPELRRRLARGAGVAREALPRWPDTASTVDAALRAIRL